MFAEVGKRTLTARQIYVRAVEDACVRLFHNEVCIQAGLSIDSISLRRGLFLLNHRLSKLDLPDFSTNHLSLRLRFTCRNGASQSR